MRTYAHRWKRGACSPCPHSHGQSSGLTMLRQELGSKCVLPCASVVPFFFAFRRCSASAARMILRSDIDTRSHEFAANAETMRALVADLRDKVTAVAQGGGNVARQRHRARGKLLARERVAALIDPGSPFLELSQLAAYGLYGGEVPIGRHRHRHRQRRRTRMCHRGERRYREGRYLFPNHREETPARPGDRPRQPAALSLSGGFRWRLPADAGRDLPRQGPFWPDLLQSGQPVGGRHPANRRGDGLLHRRWRLCAGDE